MPITIPTDPVDPEVVLFFLKWTILIILSFYAIFSLIIVRQVDLMSKTLITSVTPFVRAFVVLHAGFAIGFIFLAFGIL